MDKDKRVIAAQDFIKRREGKDDFWKARKQQLLEAVKKPNAPSS